MEHQRASMMMTTMRSVHVRLQASKRRVNLMEKFKTDLLKDASGSEKLFPLSLESLERAKYSSATQGKCFVMYYLWTGGADITQWIWNTNCFSVSFVLHKNIVLSLLSYLLLTQNVLPCHISCSVWEPYPSEDSSENSLCC